MDTLPGWRGRLSVEEQCFWKQLDERDLRQQRMKVRLQRVWHGESSLIKIIAKEGRIQQHLRAGVPIDQKGKNFILKI